MATPAVLAAPTELDAQTAPGFRDEVAFYLAAGVEHLVIDMADVSFIDSMGIGALVAVTGRAKALGVELTIRNVGDRAASALRVSGTLVLLPIEH